MKGRKLKERGEKKIENGKEFVSSRGVGPLHVSFKVNLTVK